MTEPVFRYHPDPLATGSAMRIEHECSVCGQLRQIRYRGPIHGGQPETFCLHCIYSGEASRALGVVAVATDGSDILDMPGEFSDAIDVPHDVPHHVIEEITRRTPGFTGWQQESWLYHCGDGAAFLGPAGYRDVEPHAEALNMLRASHRQLGWSLQEPKSSCTGSIATVSPPRIYSNACIAGLTSRPGISADRGLSPRRRRALFDMSGHHPGHDQDHPC
ncbi:CbrC family protein [Micromonospora sp. SD19]